MKSTHPYYFTWNHQPESSLFPVSHAEHDEFVLADGQRIYDFLSTSFQANFGHSHPAIRKAIHAQLDAMPIASPKASFELKERASEKLHGLLGLNAGKLFYTVSGSESVENALKMARQVTGRTKILARQNSYHGASLGALSVTGDWRNEPHFTIDEHTVRIPEPADDPTLEKTRAIVAAAGPGSIAAVILETISGANGVAIPDQPWFDAMQAMCREHDILLIIDEILCGFGRTGPSFAFQAYNVEPDLICMSKAISGGYVPFGAVWSGPRVTEYYEEELLACGLTNYAHPLGMAAMEAILDLLADKAFLANKEKLESTMKVAMHEIGALDFVAEVRCRGLLAAIELKGRAAAPWQTFFEHGLHAYSKHNTVIVAPPFISTPDRLSQAINSLRQVLLESEN